MKNYIALIICLICAGLVFILIGNIPFSIFQLLPILIFYFFQITVFRDVNCLSLKICYALSFLILLVYPLIMQIVWYFDINEFRTHSSTSGLLFVWLPFYAGIPGIIPCLVAATIRKNRHGK